MTGAAASERRDVEKMFWLSGTMGVSAMVEYEERVTSVFYH